MAIYKGIEIDAQLAGIVKHMGVVEEYREVLGKLQAAWDTLTLLGQLTGTAAEMSGTRESFERLTGDLLNHLGQETRNKAVADVRAKAQSAIDILVRNLFERTADIGFLAADDDVRLFLAQFIGEGTAVTYERAAMNARFREYVAKYSVYDDIVLIDLNGRIRARLGDATGGESRHPLLNEALTTSRYYVEFYGQADFLPAGRDRLVYAFRVEDGQGTALGVLALVFRLDNEMEGIFANLLDDNAWTVLACVTADGEVIASSSEIQVPCGSRLPQRVLQADGQVVNFGGRQYLTVATQTHGYQGYMGPGWMGIGMIPVEFAFDRDDSTLLAHVDHAILERVMQHPTLFSEGLRNIPLQAERIQEDLNRSVWNGSVRQAEVQNGNAAFSKTLLWEISNAGRKTQSVFEQSIGNLHQTVVAAILQNSLSCAAFAIDVMDRNLYERANDCRWWALNATFRRVLAGGPVTPEDQQRCSEILAYINGLYTVYENLVLFDAHGTAVAVSKPDHQQLVGRSLGEEWVGRCLALSSSQGYAVSEFHPSALYHGRATYVYGAAVSAPEGGRAVGGIGIVFDGTPQFTAMLSDALPRDGAGHVVPGAFMVFLDQRDRVIAASDERFLVGSEFPVRGAGEVPTGSGMSSIVEIAGQYFAIGSELSSGYREYKTSDAYSNHVVALCGFPLGAVSALDAPVRHAAVAQGARRHGGGKEMVELATFNIGKLWLGVPASEVVEAIDAGNLTMPVGAKGDVVAGYKMHRGQLISVIRLDKVMHGPSGNTNPQQIVILRTHGKVCIGILVDSLGEIPEVPHEDIQSVSDFTVADGILITAVVRGLSRPAGQGDTLLSLLGTDRLCQRLGCYSDCRSDRPASPLTVAQLAMVAAAAGETGAGETAALPAPEPDSAV
jgi:chemotaxis signal transduction protein